MKSMQKMRFKCGKWGNVYHKQTKLNLKTIKKSKNYCMKNDCCKNVTTAQISRSRRQILGGFSLDYADDTKLAAWQQWQHCRDDRMMTLKNSVGKNKSQRGIIEKVGPPICIEGCRTEWVLLFLNIFLNRKTTTNKTSTNTKRWVWNFVYKSQQ